MTANEPRQRRGKKENAKDATTVATTTNDNNTSKKQQPPDVVEEYIQKAEMAVEQAVFATDELHTQWRSYLRKLSFLLVILALHQFHSISGTCLRDVKYINGAFERHHSAAAAITIGSNTEQPLFTGLQALGIVLLDSVQYVVGIAMAFCLAFFLQSEKTKFDHPAYMLANACVLPIVGIHFKLTTGSSSSDKEAETESNTIESSCVPMSYWKASGIDDISPLVEDNNLPARLEKQLPVVIIFHVIVTMCCWFMQHQMQQHRHNIIAVQELRRNLEEKQKAASKSKTGNPKKKNK